MLFTISFIVDIAPGSGFQPLRAFVVYGFVFAQCVRQRCSGQHPHEHGTLVG